MWWMWVHSASSWGASVGGRERGQGRDPGIKKWQDQSKNSGGQVGHEESDGRVLRL